MSRSRHLRASLCGTAQQVPADGVARCSFSLHTSRAPCCDWRGQLPDAVFRVTRMSNILRLAASGYSNPGPNSFAPWFEFPVCCLAARPVLLNQGANELGPGL